MVGTNGLAPYETLRAAEKCPEAPGKRKFHSLIEAEKAAAFSSSQYRKTIVPYACSGCGLWHVTGKVRGSDVAKSRPDGVIQTTAMTQRESLALSRPTTVERVDMSEIAALESPIVPGNAAAREKILRAFLDGKTSITVPEVMNELGGVSRHVASKTLNDLGWTGRRGRPEWYPPGADVPLQSEAKKIGRPPGRSTARPAREKKLQSYLRGKDEVITADVMQLLDCGKATARELLREQGWTLAAGRPNGTWMPGQVEQAAEIPKPAPPVVHAAPIDLAMRRHPSASSPAPAALHEPIVVEPTGWRTLDNEQLVGMTLAQMNQTLSPFGLEVRLQIREIG